MSTSWEYGNVSPARYPNPGRKRKSSSTKSSHPTGKKKKEEKEKEVIQNMTHVGLEAFKKNEATYLGDMPDDHDPVVLEVKQERVSFPQLNEKETQTAVEELMNELSVMDQTTQTSPPPPPQFTWTRVYDSAEEFAEAKRQTPPPSVEDDNEGLKRMVRMATIFQSPAFQKNPRPRPPPSSVDYMVCPCHEVRLEEHQSQKGWNYVKCPRQPCLLFCAKEKAHDYMKEVYRQPHPEVCDMWSCLMCFCREPATLQQSHSQDNPDRLFVTCSKKKCNFFRSADQPLGQKYWKWFHDNPPKKAAHQAEHPLPTLDADGYPKRGYDIPGPPPRVRRQEEVERERPLTDYENQLLREIQELKNRQEVLVAPEPPPPKYSDSVQNWQKSLETVAYDRTGLF